ncbi:hypothetical protein M419DRAFT_125948 [Trichoderma reesei RUT C-30]|uniref:Uncharacterized protein n=1 Tax=Hypocrea jecorina (strain ATCC 56765 / BCRC 32924 / NRRL 11460 / Rut C-30) TaxID=1344414 RepID=A0A024SKD8_HYPJR|nr:hypothetical protein M419DRAFT_125948 [Trichoderma reesei RUT C-30]
MCPEKKIPVSTSYLWAQKDGEFGPRPANIVPSWRVPNVYPLPASWIFIPKTERSSEVEKPKKIDCPR